MGLRRIVADSPESVAGAAIGLMLIGLMPEEGTEGAAAVSAAGAAPEAAGATGLMVIGLISMGTPGLTG
jgi:hypothetical protein